MLRNVLLSALLTCFVFIIGLTLALGGCGKKGVRKDAAPRNAVCPVPAKEGFAKDSGDAPEKIGDDAGRVGRLEEEATVTARVFYAGGGEADPGKVKVMPGTWLVPGAVFVTPEEAGTVVNKNETPAVGVKDGGK